MEPKGSKLGPEIKKLSPVKLIIAALVVIIVVGGMIWLEMRSTDNKTTISNCKTSSKPCVVSPPKGSQQKHLASTAPSSNSSSALVPSSTPKIPTTNANTSQTLADTGPGNYLPLFIFVSLFGYLAHRFFTVRKQASK